MDALLVSTLLLAAVPVAADPPLMRYTYEEPLIGTRFRIVLYAPDKTTADRAARAAYDRATELDLVMSDYKKTSELMRLCDRAGGEAVKVSEDLFTVLERAQTVARRSEGAFDVTVGPLIRLWRRSRRTRLLPESEELARSLALVGYRHVELDVAARTVRLTKAGMQLDLGGIAKGYTADQMLAAMRRLGVTRALVAAGGDVTVAQRPPDADAWSVAIAPLADPDAKPQRVLLLEHAAVSTSGDAEQYVEIGGKRYSHIVDPRTGIGLVGRMSATVVAPNGLTADSLTKVLAVLGPEKGFAILEETHGVSGYFVRKTEKGEEISLSRRFSDIRQRSSGDR